MREKSFKQRFEKVENHLKKPHNLGTGSGTPGTPGAPGAVGPVGQTGPTGPAGAAGSDADVTFITVAASNTMEPLRSAATYQCDGINDEVQINAALAAVDTGTDDGGMVLLLDGKFKISGFINVPNYCHLRGVGSTMGQASDGPTLLEVQADFDRSPMSAWGYGWAVELDSNSVLTDLIIDSLYGVAGTGLMAVRSGGGTTTERVSMDGGEERIVNVAGVDVTTKVVYEGSGGDVTIRNCRADSGAIYISGGEGRVEDNYQRQGGSILISGGGSFVSGNYTTDDMYVSGGDSLVVGNNVGDLTLQVSGTVSGNNIRNSLTTASSGVVFAANRVGGASALVSGMSAYLGNRFTGLVTVTGNDNYFDANHYIGGVTDNGTGNRISASYNTTVGDGVATTYVITHNRNNQWCNVQLFLNSGTFAQVYCDVELTSATTCTLKFVTPPTVDQYRVVVAG